MREGLGAAEPCIGWADRTGRCENGPIAFQHHKTRLLIGQPAQRCQRHETIRTDHDQSAKAMPNTGKTELPAFGANAVVEKKVPAIHANLYAVSEEGYDSVTRHDRIVG